MALVVKGVADRETKRMRNITSSPMHKIAISTMTLFGVALFMVLEPALAGQEKNTESISTNEPQKPTEEKVEIPGSLADRGMNKPTLQLRNTRYKLRYGDVFELKFPMTPEFDQPKVTVHPDGYITLAGIGDLHVEGKTEEELILALRSSYAKILKDPIISVTLVDFEKPYFVVGGQVVKPGKYDMRGDTSVLQAVNIAGGLTVDAKHSQVLLLRRVSDEWGKVIPLDLKKMENDRDFSEDLHLQPGDMVVVPKSLVGKIKTYVRFDQLIWMAARGL